MSERKKGDTGWSGARGMQGLYSPGHHVPVVASSALYQAPVPDAALLLAWNFADPIIKAHRRFLEQGGQFIIPLPTVKIISEVRA